MLLLCTTVAALCGCTQFPDLDDAVPPASEVADYPDLVPIDTLLAGNDPDPTTGQQEADALEARAAQLRARAARLQGGVVDPGTRARMQDGVQTE
ncbi:hypothetical protein [Thalassococcus sp. S3]|uniref:hypothetical protein n=1 Tax=Thalassococcus sp. S3 TaxID=2017482 RepID=UPI00102466E6|nr:hypothetical protein [Thalassococcus sp. S3]QBF31201.1 hypothetical protein CFI11_08220 [Thalassococcus sp. S3]